VQIDQDHGPLIEEPDLGYDLAAQRNEHRAHLDRSERWRR
jgi:hypothetical protein